MLKIKKLFCRHMYIEWENGFILKEPYCLKCGKKKPKKDYHKFTKMVNEKVEEK